MGNFLIKLTEGDYSLYLNWSTVVDAPTVIFDDLDDIRQWTSDEYGKQGLRDLPERLDRLESKGTSSFLHGSAEEVVSFNRAGKNETCLTVAQIIQFYGSDQSEGEQPVGTKPWGAKEHDAAAATE